MTRLDSRLPIGLRLRYYYKIGTFTSGELQVECCVDFHQGSGRTASNPGRPAPGPTRPAIWPTWSTCQIHQHGDDNFDIWLTSLCHPLKCSNLVPKFLKSNKH
jgi:hypothetical protein